MSARSVMGVVVLFAVAWRSGPIKIFMRVRSQNGGNKTCEPVPSGNAKCC